MPLDPAPLNAAANTIRSETGFKRNTAIRIGDMFLNLIAALGTIELTPGDDGEEVSLQKTATHIQWRLGAGSWVDLVPLDDIKGGPGDDGEEVSLQKTATHIQWRLGAGSWANLVPLEDIKGDDGDYYSFRVFEGVFQIRLSTLTDPEPWINLFYATDEIEDIVETKVPNHSPQFVTDPGTNITRFVSKWLKKASTVPDVHIVTFDENSEVGDFNDPIYFYLDQETGTPAPVRKNEVVMFHSSNVIPSIITDNPFDWDITGTYLTGTANINILHFIYGVDGTVSLQIFQKPASNTDPSIPNLDLAVDLLLNETDTIVANFPLVDSGYFDVNATIKNINNTVNATRTALGGIYFYNLGIGSTNAERSWIEISQIPGLEETNSFTFFIKMKITTPNGSTAIELFNNQELALADGTGNLRIYTNGTGTEIWVQIGAYSSNSGDGNAAFQVRSSSSFGGITGFDWVEIAVTYDNTNVKIYETVSGTVTDIVTSADDGNGKLAGRKINNGNPFLIGRRKDSTTVNREYDVQVVKVWNKALTLSEIQTMRNALPS